MSPRRRFCCPPRPRLPLLLPASSDVWDGFLPGGHQGTGKGTLRAENTAMSPEEKRQRRLIPERDGVSLGMCSVWVECSLELRLP